MTAVQEATTVKLLWAMGRFWRIVVVVVVVCSAIVVLAGYGGSPGYKAHALVVAAQTPLSQAQLPRLGSAVFNSGEVASAVIAAEKLKVAPDELIPKQVSVVPFNDTVLFQVNAQASTADGAARLANDAADAFVVEMNKPGRGIGTFEVQERAESPTKPASSPRSAPVLLAIGLIGGLALAIFGLVIFVALRRPVSSEIEAEHTLGVSALGTLVVSGRGAASTENVGGLRPITRSLERLGTGPRSLAVVPCGDDWSTAATVAGLLASSSTDPDLTVIGDLARSEPSEIPEVALEADIRVLVVPIGVAESTAREARREFVTDELDRIVCLDRRINNLRPWRR